LSPRARVARRRDAARAALDSRDLVGAIDRGSDDHRRICPRSFFSSLHGLKEVALFAATGLLATLLATRYLLPALLPQTPRPMAPRRWLVAFLERGFIGLERSGRLLWALPVLVVLLAAIGLPKASWNPQFASLGQLDPAIRAEDTRVRERVTHAEQLIFVAAIGADDEQALQINDRIASALRQAKAAQELSSYRSLAALLPSARTQREVAAVICSQSALEQRFERAFAKEGFRIAAFAPFFSQLAREQAPPLTYRQLSESPFAMLVRPFRLQLEGKIAMLTLLSNVQDADALRRRLAAIDGAVLVRQSELFGRANRLYQKETALLLSIGLAAVLLLLVLRYRRFRSVFSAFVPALFAAVVTVSVLGVAGHPLDLVSLTSLLMVVSMGVDYGVFLVDTQKQAHGRRAALLSVFVTGLSTIFGFGLLGLSSHPVLRSIGLTAGVGIIACLLFAPVAVVLSRSNVDR
jgi:predicted exporter